MNRHKRILRLILVIILVINYHLVFAFPFFLANTPGSSFTPTNIPELLGWVPESSCKNICCGYYKDPLAAYANVALPPPKTTSVLINANQSTFSQTGNSILIGNVTFVQPGRYISSNEATLTHDPVTGQASTADLKGHVVLREPGKLVVGESGHIDFKTRLMSIYHAIYHYKFSQTNPFSSSSITNPKPAAPNTSNLAPTALPPPPNAWGIANSVAEIQKGIIELTGATYTTCAPTGNTWRVSADKIILNQNTGKGVAYNAWMDVKGIPVFYTPYFSFPIQKKRQTGFLFPSVSHTSTGGFSIALPFYWNIAPNYDATITPVYFTQRGIQGNALFRYLFPWTSGQFSGGYLPHDDSFEHFQQSSVEDFAGNSSLGRLENSEDDRGYFSWQNKAAFDSHWQSSINYNYVTDDYYIEDFGMPSTLVQNQLQQQGNLSYHGDVWTFLAKMQNYETLHPVNEAIIDNAYQSLPELDLNAALPNQAFGLDYALNNQFVFFQRSHNPGETPTTNIGLNPDGSPPASERFNFNPSVSLPITGMPGYIKPTIQFDDTYYNIYNQVQGYANTINRAIPSFDIDAGLYFDRDISLFNNSYQQTLEPRVMYLRVPYVNQTDIPIFDSALIPFTYNSLFLTNRFSGDDRIGDANQVSYSLTTRILDEITGSQKFSASLGEIYYFDDRRVSACNPEGTPGAVSSNDVCTNPLTLIGATSPTEKLSPVAGQATYNFTKDWSATASGAFDFGENSPISANLNLQYMPEQDKIVNLNYNFLSFGNPPILAPGGAPEISESAINNLNTVGVSGAWPIYNRWQVVAGWNYDIAHRYPQTYLYGLEYSSCCWAVRAVAGRVFTGLNENNNPMFNNSVYLQWQFTGLGSVGNSDPASLLVGNIPGYTDVFDNYSALKELNL